MTYQYIDLETIRLAKKRIVNDEDRFICTAISSGMTEATPEEFESKKRMLAFIKYLLGEHSTYDDWLRTKHPELLNERGEFSYSLIKKSRIAWLKWISSQLRKYLKNGDPRFMQAA